MPDKTPFAGLERLIPGDALDLEFLYDNPTIIDRLLKAGILHRHDAHSATPDPTAAPTAVIAATGGQLPSDSTIEVVYTWLDSAGGETLPSDPALVTTNDPLATPATAPTPGAVDTTAGNLLADTYYFAVSVTDGVGGETPLGPAIDVTVDPGFDNAQIPLSGLAAIVTATGGAGWRIWVSQGTGDWVLVGADSTGVADTFTWDGNFLPGADPTAVPADDAEGTNSTAVLHVHVPGPAPDTAVSFNLYASFDEQFDSPALLGNHSLADLGTDMAFATLDLLQGSPPATSYSLAGAAKIDPDTELVNFPWKRPVATLSALPSTGNTNGDVREVLDERVLYIWDTSGTPAWRPLVATGHIIQDEGSPLTTRSALDFIGTGVAATDDAPNNRTKVTIPGLVDLYRGAWASGTAYVAGQLVSAGGGTYVAIAATTGNDPTTDGGVHWELFAAPGAAGTSFTWRGAWSSSTTYHANDAVEGSDGTSYIAIATTTNNDPVTDGGVHWSPLAVHGLTGPAGPTGATGATGATGPAGLTWRGNWASGTAYVTRDAVDRNGTSYIAVSGTTGVDPATDGGVHWQELAAKGDTGPAGAPAGTWHGAWSSSTAYVSTDIVSRLGSTYIAVASSTNVDPSTDGGTHWQLVAQKGDTGATGATGPAGPLIAREDKTVTATALAAGASATVDATIYKGFRILRIQANRPCRVRLYPNATYRTADASRGPLDDPTGDHGVLLEMSIAAADEDYAMAPPVQAYNLDSTVATTAYFAITNNDTSTGDVILTITLAQTE